MAICLSHGGRTIFRTPEAPTEVLVATAGGLYSLRRQGQDTAWQVADRYLEGRHVNAIIIEPASGAIFAGMHNGGVAVSEDGGRSWEYRSAGLASENVYSLNYQPGMASPVVFAGTEPANIHRSRDLGRSWELLPTLREVPSVPRWTFPGPPHIAHVKDIVFDPGRPQTVYASVEQGGLLKSEDSGDTWREVRGWMELSGFYNDDPHRLIIRPDDSDEMFLPTGFGLYRSHDGGETWETSWEGKGFGIGYPDLLVYHPDHEDLMFIAGGEANPGDWLKDKGAWSKVARSRDGGDNWELLPLGRDERLQANFEAMSMAAWDGGYELFIGNTAGEVYSSSDEGETWVRMAEGLPAVSKGDHYRMLHYAARD